MHGPKKMSFLIHMEKLRISTLSFKTLENRKSRGVELKRFRFENSNVEWGTLGALVSCREGRHWSGGRMKLCQDYNFDKFQFCFVKMTGLMKKI